VLGRIGYDLYAVEHNLPLAEVEHFSRHVGGSSANIAVGLARLGLNVGLISAVGKDLLADYLLGFLNGEGLDTSCVRLVDDYNTSLCLSEVSPPDSFPQVFYRSQPADMQLVLSPTELAYIQRAKVFVTNGTSLACSPSRESTLDALKTAREAGLRTVFDIDYRSSSWPSAKEAGRVARTALHLVDIVLGNEDELAILTGTTDSAAQVRLVLGLGIALLVRKLGPKGVEAHTKDGFCSAPSWPTAVTCGIGGGDAFAAGFIYGLYRELTMEECLDYGNAAAAVVVSRVSCSDSMPRLEELQQTLRAATF